MKTEYKLLIAFLIVLSLFCVASCSLDSRKDKDETANFFVMNDTQPPVLQEVESVDSSHVRLVFNESVTPYSDSFEPFEVQSEGYSIIVSLRNEIHPGNSVVIKGRVKDSGGNTTGIETPVWGYNADIPEMVINEFSARGEGNNPDRTEIKVLSDGNLAGAVLYNGIPDSWDSRAVFDDIPVTSGSFIVVWWTTELPDGVTNTANVINVCAHTNTGLPGYNGAVVLCSSPAQGAEVLDCVVYSNFSATYEGFGSKTTYDRVSKAVSKHWWPSVAEAVDSSYSTATRTFCRTVNCNEKSNCLAWYVCDTKGSSFGEENTSKPYEKQI